MQGKSGLLYLRTSSMTMQLGHNNRIQRTARNAAADAGRSVIGQEEKVETKEVVKEVHAKSNPAQRIVIAVAVPFVVVLLGWGMMAWLNTGPGPFRYGRWDATELDETWFVWLLMVGLIAVFEYLWFSRPGAKA
jgi:hypothetical protein